ncbi:hypothetical protein [Wolbachia endosymbiont (group A) of Anomoia purmunda]|uniref:hypothetical protein n=1 Tax=Wolbachia endosymbiont (group A) of Anomoia purmunda TaxID=2953978 RepID=UPI00223285F8|nr:hypothetical protein [Wolbachia endosymbiont (group A) of Anomoia purmunda]
MTAVLLHTAIHSRYPLAANKQRDDGCRLAINIKKFTKRKKRQKKPWGYYPL